MRRKILPVILSAAMVLSMAGCSDKESVTTTVAESTVKETEKPTETEKTVETEKPAETEKPVETEKPAETEKPTESEEPTETETPEETTEEYKTIDDAIRSFMMTVDNKNGAMDIYRMKKDKKIDVDEDTWTIFVYMCGADLETDGAFASLDIQEMIDSSANDNIRFVVYTGGAKKWQNEAFDAEKNYVLLIQNGFYKIVGADDPNNMGDPETLLNFLSMGIEEYAAEKMGLIFWDHGSGSINGVCFDEQYQDDSLSLMEIDAALLNIYNTYENKFEFIGFDACLMATIETANVMATYANYMYASEEIIPDCGWNYIEIGNYLAKNNTANGLELGKVVSDTYMATCTSEDRGDGVTFTVFDLNKLDDLLVANNEFFYSVFKNIEKDSSVLSEVVRGIYTTDNFGGNNKTEGYTNMVDMGGIINNLSQYGTGADAVMKAMKNVVAYNINGAKHSEATGISTYYPLEVEGSEELEIFANICISPYYLSLIDMIQKSQYIGTDFSDYTIDDIFGEDGWQQGGEYNYDDEQDELIFDDDFWADLFGYVTDEKPEPQEDTITYEIVPSIDEGGTFFFVLDDNGFLNTVAVDAAVYQDLGDDVIEIGETADVLADWEKGVFKDYFDGYWISLPDGQNLALYIVSETADGVVYTSPIKLNGVETNLRFTQSFDDNTITIDGIWSGIDDNGFASRDLIKLEEGDEIVPLYYVMDEDEYYVGYEYYYKEGDQPEYYIMDEGTYYYQFLITDIYGNRIYTPYATYYVDEDGNLFFDYGDE